MISLSKIARQMWFDQPFSQRNKAERAVRWGVGGDRERVGFGKKIEKRGRRAGNIGGGEGLHKIGGLGALYQLCWCFQRKIDFIATLEEELLGLLGLNGKK